MLKNVRSIFKAVLTEGMGYEAFTRQPSERGGGALGAGEVMTGEEDIMCLSIRPPLLFLGLEERRAIVSFGLTNDTIKEGKRFWDRYVEENEREGGGRTVGGWPIQGPN